MVRPDEIDDSLPRFESSLYMAGGTMFEREVACSPVKPGSRAYSLGLSSQNTTKFVAPQRDGKYSAYGQKDPGLSLRAEIIDVSD